MSGLLEHLRRLLTYDAWANGETLRSLRDASSPPAAPLATMAHIVAAKWLWLDRLQANPPRIAVWPELTVEQCAAHLEELNAAWQSYLATLDAAELEREISYTNSKGEAWTSSVESILTHLAVHGGYHRGQIASALRAAGFTPAYTDYIHAARQGLLM